MVFVPLLFFVVRKIFLWRGVFGNIIFAIINEWRVNLLVLIRVLRGGGSTHSLVSPKLINLVNNILSPSQNSHK